MYFLQVFQPPIDLVWGDLWLVIPKLELQNVVEWGETIREQDESRLTEGMDDNRRRQYLNFYPVISPDLTELRRRLLTPPGITHVLTICLAKASVFAVEKSEGGRKKGLQRAPLDAAEIEKILTTSGGGTLGHLALILADLNDTSLTTDPDKGADDGDPLKRSGKAGSPGLPADGKSTLRSFMPPIAGASIPADALSPPSKPI